jgi:tetratricopeptide (TPR) repeat protein
VLALVVGTIAVPIFEQKRREANLRAKDDLYATLPSVLAVEGQPAERVLAQLQGEHRTAIDLLDRILALDAGDLPTRLWRACLRLDLGDRAGAAEDLKVIAADTTSPYLSALAGRYAAADPQKGGALAIDTSGLPEPKSDRECYVAGMHELRARHLRGFAQRADALLATAAETYLPARDLRLLSATALAEQTPEDERQPLLDFIYDESLALETIYDHKTARTLAMRGVALILMRRYADAAKCFEQSLELRPERHGPHQNLGIAYLRLGRFEDSERHLKQALEYRSFAWNTKHTLAQLERMRGNYAAAYAWADVLGTTGNSGEAWRAPSMVGTIAVDEALALRRVDAQKSRAAAGRAIEAYDRALQANPSNPNLKLKRQAAIALQAVDVGPALVEYAKLLEGDKTLLKGESDDAYELANLAGLVPDSGLDAAQTAWLLAVLRKVAASRAAGNEALRTRLLRENDERLKPYR